MTPYDMLIAQASALMEAAEHQHEKMVSLAAPQQNGLTRLNKLVSSQLRDTLTEKIKRLEKFLQKTSPATDLAVAQGDFRKIELECRNLFSECLALSIAPAIRSLDLDEGACNITEAFLSDLGDLVRIPWPHLTTLADTERFTTASQVIRLRYPASDIWDYPIAAHEFGHFIGPRMPFSQGSTALQTFLATRDLGVESLLEEYFSDLLATFLIGPAYVATCLLHRFDPTSAGDAYHPSDQHRAVWILTGLEQLAKLSQDLNQDWSATVLKQLGDNLCSQWTTAIAASGTVQIDTKTIGFLRTRARRLWGDLVGWCGSAAYTNNDAAMTLRAIYPDAPNFDFEIRDVYNAAWIIRLDLKSDLSDPNKRANYFEELRKLNLWAKDLCLKKGTQA